VADTQVGLCPLGAALLNGTGALDVRGSGFSLSATNGSGGAPFLLLSVVLNVAFGLLARIAPQVQIYFLVVPGQIVLGLLLLALLLPAMLGLYSSIARETFLALPGAR
jgi:flagellar biosynthetic protein FliR